MLDGLLAVARFFCACSCLRCAMPRALRSTTFSASIDVDARFYFVHSYHVKCERPEDAAATTTHGYPFVSMVHCGNIVGTQFHPEKSHFYGMKVMKSFATEISNAAA